jgi:hypothetical protein
MNTADIISSVGVVFILLAFFLLSTGKLKADGKLYNLMNIVGAGLAGISAYMINSVPFVILESIWVGAAVYGLFTSRKGLI